MTKRSLLREQARERQAWERERAMLVETICRLAGKPSQLTEIDLQPKQIAEPVAWTPSPEQYPLD